MAVLVSGYAAPRIGGGLVETTLRYVRETAVGLAREWQVRRALHAVSRLSDVELSDIGIGRGFEEEAVRHGRFARQAARPLAEDTPLMPASWTEWR